MCTHKKPKNPPVSFWFLALNVTCDRYDFQQKNSWSGQHPLGILHRGWSWTATSLIFYVKIKIFHVSDLMPGSFYCLQTKESSVRKVPFCLYVLKIPCNVHCIVDGYNIPTVQPWGILFCTILFKKKHVSIIKLCILRLWLYNFTQHDYLTSYLKNGVQNTA